MSSKLSLMSNKYSKSKTQTKVKNKLKEKFNGNPYLKTSIRIAINLD